MNDPIPLTTPYLGEEEVEAAAEAIRSGWVAQGPRVAEFEAGFAEAVGAMEGVAVSSATAGLHLAMISLGIGPGDEVVVPSLSFIASANAPRYVGATPVFADVDPKTFNLTAGTIEQVISDRTRAIIVVHQLGMPADIQAIRSLCEARGIEVVEDAACAIGSTYRGEPIGSHSGHVIFSLHPRKLLTTGEGGMITTSSGLAARLRRLRQHGMTASGFERSRADRVIVEEYIEEGYNYRLTDIQAAIGIVQLGRLDEIVEQRRKQAAFYTHSFDGLRGITTPADPSYGTTNHQSFWIRVDDDASTTRDGLIASLGARGIAAKPALMAAHLEPTFSGHPHAPLPVTEQIHRDGLVIPLFHGMSDQQLSTVVEEVVRVAGG